MSAMDSFDYQIERRDYRINALSKTIGEQAEEIRKLQVALADSDRALKVVRAFLAAISEEIAEHDAVSRKAT